MRRGARRGAPAPGAGPAARDERLWIALLPAGLLILLVVGYPIGRVMVLALCDFGLSTGFKVHWRGLQPFANLAADSRFTNSLLNTGIFTLASVAIEGALGLLVALLLHRPFRGRRAVRAVMMLPWAMPTAVMALAWTWIFNDAFGVVNDLLARLGLAAGPIPWLGEPRLAMTALVIADVWKTTPFVALILLAGIAGIPASIAESAQVDGIGAWRRFTVLTLPLLKPFLVVALLFRGIQAWAAFDLVYVMTGGGPGGATETVSLYAQQTYFRYLDFGYASTMVVASLVVLGAAAGGVHWLARERAA